MAGGIAAPLPSPRIHLLGLPDLAHARPPPLPLTTALRLTMPALSAIDTQVGTASPRCGARAPLIDPPAALAVAG
jgi:hypothetical protein